MNITKTAVLAGISLGLAAAPARAKTNAAPAFAMKILHNALSAEFAPPPQDAPVRVAAEKLLPRGGKPNGHRRRAPGSENSSSDETAVGTGDGSSPRHAVHPGGNAESRVPDDDGVRECRHLPPGRCR